MATVRFVLLCSACISPFAFAQLPTSISITPTTPPLSGTGTCNNPLSSTMVSMFSPDSAFSTVVLSGISFVNSTVICTSMEDSEVAKLTSTLQIYLFYGNKSTDYQSETLDNIENLLHGGHWNFSRPATCFFPGWRNGPNNANYSMAFVEAYFANNTQNVLVVDWSKINNMEYTRVVSVMPNVAQSLASAFDKLSNASKGNVTEMVFVGHSLGSHLAGYTSRRLTILNITMLAALDPAGPLFGPVPWRCQEGVRANDARSVVAVHTDGGRFGIDITIGIVDYYPNNGTYIQPGCTPYDSDPDCPIQFLCSHRKGLFYWCDAVRRPGTLIGRLCGSSSAFAAGMCEGNVVNEITASTSISGTYYFNTNSDAPYGQGINGA